jgi:hypothetical protein
VRGAEGEWYERHTISQDLPQLATDALVVGWDTQSLRVLAGESPSAYALDLGDLLARALLELGPSRPISVPRPVAVHPLPLLVDRLSAGRERLEVESELSRAAQELLERPLPD